MKKMIKKVSAVVLVLLLVVSLGAMGASASGTDRTDGSIQIFKYSPLGTGTTPGDGVNGPDPADYRGIQGVEYQIYQVATWTGNKVGSGYTAVPAFSSFTITDTTTPAEIYAKITADTMAADYTVETDSTGSVTVPGLALGLYLVVETDATGATYVDGNKEAANITQLGAPFFVSVPMTNSAGTAWIYDIKVYPKNATATATKEADEEVAGVGDKVTYTLTVGVPENIKDLKKFIVTDTLPDEVNYEDAKVYTDAGKTTELASSAFVLAPPPKTGGGDVKVTFTVTDTALQALKGSNVYIVIETFVNNQAVTVNEIDNTASIDYGDDVPNVDIEAKTYVGKVEIEKVDKDNPGTKLQGVKFKIYKMNGTNKVYLVNPATGTGEYEVTTGPDGKATFAGLNNGIYYIEEVLAHGDYQLLKDPVEVEITNDQDAPTVTKVISNIKKFNLPITGGMGTMLFTGIGVALIGVGVVIFFVSSVRRRRRQQNKHT